MKNHSLVITLDVSGPAFDGRTFEEAARVLRATAALLETSADIEGDTAPASDGTPTGRWDLRPAWHAL